MSILKKPSTRFLVLAAAGLAVIAGASVTTASRNVFSNVKTYTSILANVYDKYVEEVDSKDLIYASIRGMMSMLDPHSTFLEKKQYDDLMLETQGKYGGVGISIDIRDGWLTVVSPIEGTPAYKLGIRAGDQIIAIEGESTKGITTLEAAKKLRGRKGTKVTITIARKGEPAPFDIEIERDVIELRSVPYAAIVRDGVGYLRLSRFSEEAGKEVEEALGELVKEGARGVVFDLRWNHGGLLTQAVSVSDKFLEKGQLISYTQGRRPSDRQEYHASETPVLPADIPLVVLVNGATASASEIVSGALQDNGRAVILGEPTYGKGLVQTLIPLDSETNLKLTTAKWYTPSGRCIQREEPKKGETVLSHESEGEEEPEAEESEETGDEQSPSGGIQPDVIAEGEYTTQYGAELRRGNHFFRFAVNYVAQHPEVPRDFRASDEVLAEFAAYLKEQGFDYRTAAEIELERIQELPAAKDFSEETRAALEELAVRLEAEKERDFERNRDYIAYGIEWDVMNQLYGTEGAYEVQLRNDSQAQAAMELLLDEAAYQQALRGKEPIAAVGEDG